MSLFRRIAAAGIIASTPFFLRASDAADELKLAVQKLSEAHTYAWKQTLSGPDYKTPVVSRGTTERDGYTVTELAVGDHVSWSVRKGEHFSVTQLQNGQWQTSDEAQALLSKKAGREFPRSTNPLHPAQDLERLLPHLFDCARSGDFIIAKIGDPDVARRYTLGVVMKLTKTHQADATFWLKEGSLAKYELRFNVDVVFRGKDEKRRPILTVELSEIGTAAVNLPPGARPKLGVPTSPEP